MRRQEHRTVGLVIVACLLLGAGAARADSGWKAGASLRQEVAAAQGRQLLVKIGTAWCSACRELERVLARPKVQRALAGYLRLAYDAEVGEGEDVARRYNAVTFPTLLVLGPDGLELGRVTGSLGRAALLARLAAIKDGSGTVKRLQAQLARRPKDLALRLRVGRAWALKGRRIEAERELSRVVAADPDNARGLAARALLIQGKILQLRSLKRYQQAERTLRALRRRFPRAPQAEQAIYPLARALHYQGKTDAALGLLKRAAAAPGASPVEQARGRALLGWFCWYHKVRPAQGYQAARAAAAVAALEAKERASAAAVAGLLAKRLGRLQQARAHLRRAITLDPTHAWYRRNLKALAPRAPARSPRDGSRK